MFLIAVQSTAQQRGTSAGNKDGTDEKQEDGKEAETVHVKSVIRVWKLQRQFSTTVPVTLDTVMTNFHHYNPIFKQAISNNYLGFLGAPYEANLFFKRQRSSSFYFLKNLSAYRLEAEETPFYNTTTPFSSLEYTQGDQGNDRTEQTFEAFYTQNVDSTTNFGFRYHVLRNESQYNEQEANHKYMNIFASRNTQRYNGYFSLVNGTNYLLENGGITSSTISTSLDEYDIPVNLDDGIETTNKSLTIFTSHEYLMGEIPFLEKGLADSVKTGFVPRYAVQYSIEFQHYKRQMEEDPPDTTFFDTTFFASDDYIDSTLMNRFSQILQLKMFEDQKRKFTFGKRVFLENEIVKAVQPFPYGSRKYNYGNLYLGGEIYNNTSKFLKWDAYARFGMLGRNIGDAIVRGTIDKPLVLFGDTTLLHAEAWYQDQSPDIYQEHYYNNHFKWENKFRKQHEVFIRGNYSYPHFRVKAGIDYAFFANYLYNNEQALPDQYSGEFLIISAWLNKDFVLGRFGWSNKIVWQEISNDVVLHLPTWSFYSSIYYAHYLFKVMKIQLGAEVYYHTKFMADSYEPSTTRFYLQNDIETGEYPVINLFANAKLKRTNAFAQLVHANSIFKFGEFFSTPHYPLEQIAFRFGFYWTFYD